MLVTFAIMSVRLSHIVQSVGSTEIHVKVCYNSVWLTTFQLFFFFMWKKYVT